MPGKQSCKVRFPYPGEVLRLDALEAWSVWFAVHSRVWTAAPCLGKFCGLCHGVHRPGSYRWEGYLLCDEVGRSHEPFVLRLTPAVWRQALSRANWPHDLRCWLLQVERLRLGGRPSLRAQLVTQRYQEGAVEPYRTEVPGRLLAFWDLSTFTADRRSEVYELEGRIGPGFQFPAVAAPDNFATREGDT